MEYVWAFEGKDNSYTSELYMQPVVRLLFGFTDSCLDAFSSWLVTAFYDIITLQYCSETYYLYACRQIVLVIPLSKDLGLQREESTKDKLGM